MTSLSLLPLMMSPLPSCDPAGMPCTCAQGHIVVAIVQRDRHVMCKRTRPYCCRHHATQPACRAQAHEALSLLPVWQRDVPGFVVDFVDFVAVIVDIIAISRRNVCVFIVIFIGFIAVIDVVIAIARRDVNMLCLCAQGLVVQHSSFVVTDSCCRRRQCMMGYKNAGRLRTMAKNSLCTCAGTNKMACALAYDG